MLVSASRRNMLSFRLINLKCYQITKKSANAKTHSPSRETRALPPANCAAKGNLIVTNLLSGYLTSRHGIVVEGSAGLSTTHLKRLFSISSLVVAVLSTA